MVLLGETPTNAMVNGYPRLHEVAIMGLVCKRTRGSICGLDSDFAHKYLMKQQCEYFSSSFGIAQFMRHGIQGFYCEVAISFGSYPG
jgi:hypothetical protein